MSFFWIYCFCHFYFQQKQVLQRYTYEFYVYINLFSVEIWDTWYCGWTLIPCLDPPEDIHNKTNVRNQNYISQMIMNDTTNNLLLLAGLYLWSYEVFLISTSFLGRPVTLVILYVFWGLVLSKHWIYMM